MNREKLAQLKAEWKPVYEAEQGRLTFRPTDLAAPMFYVMALLDALLEESPDVGQVQGHPDVTKDIAAFHRWFRTLGERVTALEAYRRGQHVDPDLELKAGGLIVPLARRVEALEAYRKADDAYGLEVDGSLKALEGRFDRLVAVARKWRPVSPALSIFAELFDALLELPCSPSAPDVGQMNTPDRAHTEFMATMRSGQAWLDPGRLAAQTILRQQASAEVKRGATPCPVCGSNFCLGEARACDQRAAMRKAGA